MKLSDRIRIAAGALRGVDVIGQDAAKQLESILAPSSQLVGYATAQEPETKLDALVRDGWRRNELIFSCVNKKAGTASQVSLMVVNRKGDELVDHPLRALLRNPNPYMTESKFWKSVIILQDFAGNAYFEKVRSRSGRTAQLWPMRPDWVRPVPNETGMIVGYAYHLPSRAPIFFPAEDIIPFNLYDPLNRYMGYPPVAVVARIGDLDNAATDYVRLIFQEGGVPPGILTSTQPINEAVAKRIRAMYMEQYGGYQNWRAPMVLGHDTKYQSTGLGLEELGLDILDKRAEVRICAVLNVPAVIAGTRIGLERATLDNVNAYQRNWWDNDLIPLYKDYADVLMEHLVPEFGEDIELEWDFDDVPALQDDMTSRREQALNAFRSGAITRNEFNDAWGLPNLGPRGNVYVMSATLVEVPVGKNPAALPADEGDSGADDEGKEDGGPVGDEAPTVVNLPITRSKIIPMEIVGLRGGDSTGGPMGFLTLTGNLGSAGVVAKRVEFADPETSGESERIRAERRMIRALESYFRGLRGRIRARVSGPAGRRSGDVAQESKGVDDDFWASEYETLYEVMFPIILAAIVTAARDAYLEMGGLAELGISWDVVNAQAASWATKHTATVVSQISRTSMSGFLQEFEPWVNSGNPLSDLLDALVPYYGEARAEMIGITETTRAFAMGNIEFWRTTGLVAGWEWVGAEDDLVCEICQAEIDRGTHELDEDPPPAHVRCRCGTRPVMIGD